jgi:hypothetical protein
VILQVELEHVVRPLEPVNDDGEYLRRSCSKQPKERISPLNDWGETRNGEFGPWRSAKRQILIPFSELVQRFDKSSRSLDPAFELIAGSIAEEDCLKNN